MSPGAFGSTLGFSTGCTTSSSKVLSQNIVMTGKSPDLAISSATWATFAVAEAEPLASSVAKWVLTVFGDIRSRNTAILSCGIPIIASPSTRLRCCGVDVKLGLAMCILLGSDVFLRERSSSFRKKCLTIDQTNHQSPFFSHGGIECTCVRERRMSYVLFSPPLFVTEERPSASGYGENLSWLYMCPLIRLRRGKT